MSRNYKVEKEVDYKGYKCVVVGSSMGHRCGYIGLKNTDLAYEKDYDDLYCIDVHGGLTYSNNDSSYPIKNNENLWWIGFDCAHSGDGRDIELIKELNKDPRTVDMLLRWSSEYETVKTIEYCMNECKSVVEQIIEINNKGFVEEN